MNLDDLRYSISSMSDEDLFKALKEVRANRRVSKKAEKIVKEKREKASVDFSKLLSSMSDKDKMAFIAMLEGDKA